MKILLTTNKTYRGMTDLGHWYVYLPLKQLGHEVYWYDTVLPTDKDYESVIEKFRPDLIFCCMTGDKHITPHEPWQSIKKETDTGRTKTFNWFCDDTWRFNSFSKKACYYFNVCSTPEPLYLEKYKESGYDNIILGAWHANSDLYDEKLFCDRSLDISFIGAINNERKGFFDSVDIPIEKIFGVTSEEVFETHTKTKIGLNLSVNANDPEKKTQMKARMFEIPAGGGLLLTQYHDGIEKFFDIDKEIVTFKTRDEFVSKAKALLARPKIIEQLARAGHKRFLAEHDSKIRLKSVLHQIGKA